MPHATLAGGRFSKELLGALDRALAIKPDFVDTPRNWDFALENLKKA